MIFQEREWEYKGSRGMTAQPYSIITIEQPEKGNFKIPEPKFIDDKPPVSYSTNENFSSLDDDEDLPF